MELYFGTVEVAFDSTLLRRKTYSNVIKLCQVLFLRFNLNHSSPMLESEVGRRRYGSLCAVFMSIQNWKTVLTLMKYKSRMIIAFGSKKHCSLVHRTRFSHLINPDFIHSKKVEQGVVSHREERT